jgi:hypothetical protein
MGLQLSPAGRHDARFRREFSASFNFSGKVCCFMIAIQQHSILSTPCGVNLFSIPLVAARPLVINYQKEEQPLPAPADNQLMAAQVPRATARTMPRIMIHIFLRIFILSPGQESATTAVIC